VRGKINFGDVQSLGYIPWNSAQSISIVDMACGTGALSNLLLQEAVLRHQPLTLWMMDPSKAMLEKLHISPVSHHRDTQTYIVHACAEDIPLPCHSVDVYVCAFGLRNMEDRRKSMEEAHRILRPDGIIIILEFSSEVSPSIGILYHYYLTYGIPWLGKHIVHDEAAYRYLSESIAAFPSPHVIVTELAVVGFMSVCCIPLSAGVVQLYYSVRSRASRYQRKQLCGSVV
jgi:demethylmenaquinone methyltransferase/2-methoxy-6-polyprenyl-1,4-benzoquinol methylase